MIILNSTTDKIQIILASGVTANQLSCYAGYRDITITSFTPKRTITNTNNTTAVDLVPSPASSTQRVIDYISIYNKDSASSNVTVRFNDNGTTYNLIKVTIAPGEKIEYNDSDGFKVITNGGGQRTSAGIAPYSTNLMLQYRQVLTY